MIMGLFYLVTHSFYRYSGKVVYLYLAGLSSCVRSTVTIASDSRRYPRESFGYFIGLVSPVVMGQADPGLDPTSPSGAFDT